jgi:hypothetical protein
MGDGLLFTIESTGVLGLGAGGGVEDCMGEGMNEGIGDDMGDGMGDGMGVFPAQGRPDACTVRRKWRLDLSHTRTEQTIKHRYIAMASSKKMVELPAMSPVTGCTSLDISIPMPYISALSDRKVSPTFKVSMLQSMHVPQSYVKGLMSGRSYIMGRQPSMGTPLLFPSTNMGSTSSSSHDSPMPSISPSSAPVRLYDEAKTKALLVFTISTTSSFLDLREKTLLSFPKKPTFPGTYSRFLRNIGGIRRVHRDG